MADINYGYGTGAADDSATSSGYTYTACDSDSLVATFDGAGLVNKVQVYNAGAANSRIRIWKGTLDDADTFRFDDPDNEIVDISNVGTGWQTFNAPGDFTAFEVDSDTALVFYSHSTTTTGMIYGRTANEVDHYGYNSDDPDPYADTLDMNLGSSTTHRLEVKLEGDFVSAVTVTDVESDEDYDDKDTGLTITGTNFEASKGSGKVEMGDNADYATANKIEQTTTDWGDTSIDFTANLGAQSPGSKWIFVTNNSDDKNDPGFAVTVHRAQAFEMSLSSEFAPGVTTAQLTAPATKTTGDFDAGRIEEVSNPAAAIDITDDDYTEVEWCFEAVPNSEEATYDFRVTVAGVALDTYTETPQLTVEVGGGETYNESITEALAMGDVSGLGASFGMAITEGISAGEALGPPTTTLGLSITEVAALVEQVKASGIVNLSLSEALALTEDVVAGVTFSFGLSEALALTDVAASWGTFGMKVSEDLSLTDAVLATLLANLTIQELVAITDAVSAPSVGAQFNEIITETLGVTDAIRSIATLYSSIREDVALTDVTNITTIVAEAITETLGLTDTLSTALAYSLVISESVALQDQIDKATFTFNIKVTEDLAIKDTLGTILNLALHITENFSAGEVIVLTRISPTIVIRRGKTFVFTIDQVGPQVGVSSKKGHADIEEQEQTGVAPQKGHTDIKKWKH